MSEDEPLEPIASEPATQPNEPVAAESAPTEPVPTSESAGPPPWPGAPVAPVAASGPVEPPPPSSSTVAVPKWILFVAGAAVVAVFAFAVGFAAGWVAAPGDDDDRESVARLPNRVPGGNGGGSDIPTIPLPSARGALLGVTTSRSTDPAGARVEEVLADSPASEGGLEAGDVITRVDDATIANPNQLARRIGSHSPGDEVTITYVRDGSTETTEVTLVRRATFELPTPSTTQPEF